MRRNSLDAPQICKACSIPSIVAGGASRLKPRLIGFSCQINSVLPLLLSIGDGMPYARLSGNRSAYIQVPAHQLECRSCREIQFRSI